MSSSENSESGNQDQPDHLNAFIKKALADKKKVYREKVKQKAQQPTAQDFFEEAKRCLSTRTNFSVEQLLLSDQFRDVLTPSNVKRLREHQRNKLRKSKREELKNLSESLGSENMKNEAGELSRQKSKNIQAMIQNCSTPEDIKNVVGPLLEGELFPFTAFLEEYEPFRNDLLKFIVDFVQKTPSPQATKIYVLICKNQRVHHLDATPQLIEASMEYLNKFTDDSEAVQGLLKFILQNEVSLANLPSKVTRDFQNEYSQQIKIFFKNNQLIKHEGQSILPHTIYCFTKPLLDQIMGLSLGALIYSNFHPLFQFHLLQIVGHSFNSSQEDLETLMEVFRHLIDNFNQLLTSQLFINLLEAMVVKTRNQDAGYFQTLESPIRILKQVLKLAETERLPRLCELQIQLLLGDEPDSFAQMDSAPIVVKDQTNNTMERIMQTFVKNNPLLNLNTKYLVSKLLTEEEMLIWNVGFSNLMPNQHILLRFINSPMKLNQNFFQLDTGQGKTALCYIIALKAAIMGGTAFVINKSNDLTFRDFKKAYDLAKKREIDVFMYHDTNTRYEEVPQGVFYMTSEYFLSIAESLNETQISNSTFVFDEFDNLLFEDKDTSTMFIKTIKRMKKCYGLSGSKFGNHHKAFFDRHLICPLINFSLVGHDRVEPHCIQQKVISSLKAWRKEIASLCVELSSKTPTIIVNQKEHKSLFKTLQKQGLSVEDLVEANPGMIESCLRVFTKNIQGQFRVVIIGSQQARGLDFTTSPEIEEQGGVHVLIGELPDYYLHYQQYKGRTNRLGKKGQYSVILYDKESKAKEGNDYLEIKIHALQNSDFEWVTSYLGNKVAQIPNAENQLDKKVVQPANFDLEEQKEQVNILEDVVQDIKPIEEEVPKIIAEKIPIQAKNLEAQVEVVPIVKQQHAAISTDLLKKRNQYTREADNKQSIIEAFQEFALYERKNPAQSDLIYAFGVDFQYPWLELIEEGYYDNYAKEKIHKEMLQDGPRREAYRKAAINNCSQMVVLDVGTGTGAIALQCLRADAKFVHAVEASGMIDVAITNMNILPQRNKVKFYKSTVEKLESLVENNLTTPKVDIVISEWMGYFLIYENMANSVLIAKAKFLKPGGLVIPGICQLFLAPYDQIANAPLHGKFSSQSRDKSTPNFCTAWMDSKHILGPEQEILNIDMNKLKQFNNEIHSKFTISFDRDGTWGGFASWFLVEMSKDSFFGTSPFKEETHWMQQLFKIQNPFSVKAGDEIKGHIDCTPQSPNYRALDLKIQFQNPTTRKITTEIFYMD